MRRVLLRLKESGQIDQQTSNRSSLITIRNWEGYQATDQQTACKWPASGPQSTTNKKEERKECKPSSLEEVNAFAVTVGMPEKETEAFYHHYEGQGWVTGNGNPIRKWQSVLLNWKVRNEAVKPGRTKGNRTIQADYEKPNDPLTGNA